MSSSLSTFIGSLFSTEPIYNETPAPEPEKEDAPAEEAEETANENAPPAEQEEEEEEDPEDVRGSYPGNLNQTLLSN